MKTSWLYYSIIFFLTGLAYADDEVIGVCQFTPDRGFSIQMTETQARLYKNDTIVDQIDVTVTKEYGKLANAESRDIRFKGQYCTVSGYSEKGAEGIPDQEFFALTHNSSIEAGGDDTFSFGMSLKEAYAVGKDLKDNRVNLSKSVPQRDKYCQNCGLLDFGCDFKNYCKESVKK